jgi:hypothetical protein
MFSFRRVYVAKGTAPLPDMNRTLQNALNMDDEQHNDHSVRSHLFHNPLDSKPL